ncbi:uncharacterized protein CHSO_3487 [Chryseobacterium sp. StRB126]|uniref:hypothetical protein n=1 Tax=Chryseobacterium sp. StRB126 TaxID=878220 RepID=UPI0004E98B4E|nr:hypothetical protein [Chryseobacterium sp. StRB126]BAP32524.1 uncharacterized protein CHSO_3487 [Chryseobacterium sp. StRB126]
MLTIEDAFDLIKQERKFLNNIEHYKIKISNSNNFIRENLIGIYKIRALNAKRNSNDKLVQQIEKLISNLENCSDDYLRFVSISGEKYYGMFYLSKSWERIIGYLEGEIEEGNSLF